MTSSTLSSAPVHFDTDIDNETCAKCGSKGLLTQCDLCNKWFHWWKCVDDKNQPTAGEYLCGNCREHTGRHPPDWSELKPQPYYECVVCNDRKPASQFPHSILPECECKSKVCAVCAYTMADKADECNTQSKCPLCRTQWLAFVLLPTKDNAEPQVVSLGHVRGSDAFESPNDWATEETATFASSEPQASRSRVSRPRLPRSQASTSSAPIFQGATTWPWGSSASDYRLDVSDGAASESSEYSDASDTEYVRGATTRKKKHRKRRRKA